MSEHDPQHPYWCAVPGCPQYVRKHHPADLTTSAEALLRDLLAAWDAIAFYNSGTEHEPVSSLDHEDYLLLEGAFEKALAAPQTRQPVERCHCEPTGCEDCGNVHRPHTSCESADRAAAEAPRSLTAADFGYAEAGNAASNVTEATRRERAHARALVQAYRMGRRAAEQEVKGSLLPFDPSSLPVGEWVRLTVDAFRKEDGTLLWDGLTLSEESDALDATQTS